MIPGFLRLLSDPAVRTVLLCGCGGGFDFVHGLTLYPELVRLGKRVIIGSYSFGDPGKIGGEAPVVFQEGDVVARRVTARSQPDAHYAPEIHVCSFLDERYPASAPHSAYAYYARAFTVPILKRLYRQLIDEHSVDAVVLADGGSDSLMAGDEEGLGDPIEDAVSVTTVAGLEGLQAKLLLSVGLGVDRFNHVSDAASLRAVSELTARGGFLGVSALEPTSPGLEMYTALLDHVYGRQTFRSVVAGAIASAAQGWYGSGEVPELLASRIRPGQAYGWPLMAMVWGFDVDVVAARSHISGWIRHCETVAACYAAVEVGARQSASVASRTFLAMKTCATRLASSCDDRHDRHRPLGGTEGRPAVVLSYNAP